MRRLLLHLAVAVLSTLPAASQTYEIGPDDVLGVIVLGQSEMTGAFPVDRDGMLTFPILGKVKASGMSPEELERKLTVLLADGYLKRPQVSLSVKEYHSRRVYVTGEVQKPGVYPLKGDRSLRALLSEVGTLSPDAGHELVVIRPPAGSETSGPATVPTDATSGAAVPEAPGAQVFRVAVRDIQAGAADGVVQLQAGDTVYVPRAAQIYITGLVARQGPYRFQADMTVLQALTLAGGINERGSSKRVKIVRSRDGEKVETRAKMTDVVQPGDTIVVPERFF